MQSGFFYSGSSDIYQGVGILNIINFDGHLKQAQHDVTRNLKAIRYHRGKGINL